MPEIIEKAPELFEKEIKYQLECPYSSEYIEEFKNLRLKYLKWICESGDYNDQVFKEIETDTFRYSILTDDVEYFQSIVSKSDFEINMRIKESLIQNSHCFYAEEHIISMYSTRRTNIWIYISHHFYVFHTKNNIRKRFGRF